MSVNINIPSTIKKLTLLCAILFMSSQAVLAQQTGVVSGKVIDAGSGEPMVGVNVVIRAQQKYTITDMNGQYSLEGVNPGNATVEFQMAGYQRSQSQLNVRAGRNSLSVSLSYMTVGELVVTAKKVTNTEAALLSKRKKAPVAQDAISAEQISKSPDSDAADVAKRVTGVTIVNGDTVYVRGLGERYSSVEFAGSTIPSPDPDKRVVPLDVFPTSLIDSMVVTKMWIPEMHGEFAGGLVMINPKDYPEEEVFKVKAGTSINTNTSYNIFGLKTPGSDFYTYKGGDLDFLGIEDGTREYPGDLSDSSVPERKDLQNTYTPVKDNPYFPMSIGFTYGNSYNAFSNMKFGVITSGFYKESSKVTEYKYLRMGTDKLLKKYNTQKSTFSTSKGGLVSLGLTGQSQKFRYTTFYSHQSEDEASISDGYKTAEGNGDYKGYSLVYSEKSLWFNQLAGENYIYKGIKAEWNASYSNSKLYEPDSRTVTFAGPDSDSSNQDLYTRGDYIKRRWLDHDDSVYEAAPALVIPFKQWNGLESHLKVGGSYTYRVRESESKTLNWQSSDWIYEAVEDNFADDTYTLQDVSTAGSDYKGELYVYSGYSQVDIPIWHKIRFVGGARYEYADMDLKYWNPANARMEELDKEPLEKHNILPGGTITYAVTKKMNLRFGYSKTITRPDFREVTEFTYPTGEVDNELIKGNPDLKQTDIHNLDFRYEIFPSAEELVAFSVFYKDMTNPIEFLMSDSGGDAVYYKYINADSAWLAGAEVELRKSLGFIYDPIKDYSVSTNLAWIKSEVEIADTSADNYTNNKRELQGQSPYVINLGLHYDNKNSGTNVAALYNIYGRRIVSAGVTDDQGNKSGDVYEEPVAKLDFVIKQKVLENGSIKFTASNLLDPKIKQTQKKEVTLTGTSITTYDKYTLKEYKSGRSFGLSFDWSF